MSSAIDTVTESMAAATINEPTNGTTTAAATSAQNDAAMVSADEGRRLYIGNLAYATTEGELKEFFSGYSMYVGLCFARHFLRYRSITFPSLLTY